MAERKFKRQRGFVVIAEDSSSGDYLRMAYGLALSLKATQKDVPYLTVLITPGMRVHDKYKAVFDEVIELPWEDDAKLKSWKIHNKWKVYHVTPYKETIYLDADMIFPNDISDWWKILNDKDFWICTKPITFRNEIITNTTYRTAFVDNNLPMVYTAFTYFKHCDNTHKIFSAAETIYHNWETIRARLYSGRIPKEISGDLVFATAIKTLDIETECTEIFGKVPTFVHMKTTLQTTNPQNYLKFEQSMSADWTKHLNVYMTHPNNLTIGVYRQFYPFHYHVKEFLTDDILEVLEKSANV